MIFIEGFIILIALLAFIGATCATAYLVRENNFAKARAQLALKEALAFNSKEKLESVLIVYDSDLNKKVKEQVKIRIADLIIDEDENLLKKDIKE